VSNEIEKNPEEKSSKKEDQHMRRWAIKGKLRDEEVFWGQTRARQHPWVVKKGGLVLRDQMSHIKVYVLDIRLQYLRQHNGGR